MRADSSPGPRFRAAAWRSARFLASLAVDGEATSGRRSPGRRSRFWGLHSVCRDERCGELQQRHLALGVQRVPWRCFSRSFRGAFFGPGSAGGGRAATAREAVGLSPQHAQVAPRTWLASDEKRYFCFTRGAGAPRTPRLAFQQGQPHGLYRAAACPRWRCPSRPNTRRCCLHTKGEATRRDRGSPL